MNLFNQFKWLFSYVDNLPTRKQTPSKQKTLESFRYQGFWYSNVNPLDQIYNQILEDLKVLTELKFLINKQ